MRTLLVSALLFFSFSNIAFAKNEATLCRDQLSAKPTKTGFTWTLVSRLGEALRAAEKRYGKRDQSWSILGVEFSTKKQPQIWYPFSGDKQKFLIVQLTESASCDEKRALFQLSHEVIHLLSPAGGNEEVLVLEEGIATYFSVEHMKSLGFKIDESYISTPSYKEAYQLVKTLYEQHENADMLLETLRLEHETLHELKKEDLTKVFITIDEELAEKLVAKFKV